MSLWMRLKTVGSGVCRGLAIRPLFLILLYMCCLNVLTPSFTDYFYEFMQAELGFSPVIITGLALISFFVGFLFLVGY